MYDVFSHFNWLPGFYFISFSCQFIIYVFLFMYLFFCHKLPFAVGLGQCKLRIAKKV